MTRYSAQPRYWIFVKGYGFLSSRRAIQKQQKELVILLAINFLIELQKSQKRHHRITQLQMKKKILDLIEKDIYVKNKERKLLIWNVIESKLNI